MLPRRLLTFLFAFALVSCTSTKNQSTAQPAAGDARTTAPAAEVIDASGDQTVAFVNAKIIPIAGPEIERGVLVVRNGKIVSVGPADGAQVPAGAKQVDVTGKVIMPGLCDTHSHVGGVSGGDQSAALQPDVRVFDALNVREASLAKARAGGLTTINVMPGSGHLLSGQTIYLKLRRAGTIDGMTILDKDGKAMGGIKLANGTNSIRSAPFPGTRAKSAALLRELLVKGQEYREKIQKAAGDPEKMPSRDLGLEAIVEVLEGKRMVHFHTHRHDDILTILRFKKEFGFRVVLHHVSDGWVVADQIAAADVPCSIIVIDSPGGKLEAMNLSWVTGAALEKAGVLPSFHTDDGITDSRLFLRSAAIAVRSGMSREKALYAVTMANAIMMDVGDRVGTLEPGKDADFIILSGDPLSVYTHVLQTWIEGKIVFDRSDPKDRLHAVGGYGASIDQMMFLDNCMGGGEQ